MPGTTRSNRWWRNRGPSPTFRPLAPFSPPSPTFLPPERYYTTDGCIHPRRSPESGGTQRIGDRFVIQGAPFYEEQESLDAGRRSSGPPHPGPAAGAVRLRQARTARRALGAERRGRMASGLPPRAGDAPSTEDTDEALVERLRRGDSAAFDALVTRHMRRAYSVAYRLLGQKEDAEDLVQDAFVLVLERIDTFESGRPFAPWFYRILTNRGLNARKAGAVRRTEQIPAEYASGEPSPERDAERSQLRERLAAAVDTLPERQRTIVQLFELEGFSGPEIAEILEVSPATVRWHLHQARQTLRETLAPLKGRTE